MQLDFLVSSMGSLGAMVGGPIESKAPESTVMSICSHFLIHDEGEDLFSFLLFALMGSNWLPFRFLLIF